MRDHQDRLDAGSVDNPEFEDGSYQQPDCKALIAQADDLCCELVQVSQDRLDEKKECSTRLVAAIYALHEALFPRRHAYAAFLKERGVEPGKSPNEFNDTAKAVMDQHARAGKRTSIALYAQACFVLKSQGVYPSNAVRWLNEPDGKGGRSGKGRTGFGKTKLLWAETPEGDEERKKKHKAKEQKAKGYLDEKLQSSATSASDDETSTEALPSPRETGIALIERGEAGEWKVRQVLTQNVVKTAQTMKVCLSTSEADRGKAT